MSTREELVQAVEKAKDAYVAAVAAEAGVRESNSAFFAWVAAKDAVWVAAKDALSAYDTRTVRMTTESELKQCVKEFFNHYLNYYEISDSGNVKRPIYVSCGRVMKMESLDILLERMRELSGADKPVEHV